WLSSSGGTEAWMVIQTGLELAFCPSDGGFVANARTPGSSDIAGPRDSTISCWLRSRSSHGASRVKAMPCDDVGRPETTKYASASGTFWNTDSNWRAYRSMKPMVDPSGPMKKLIM